MKARDYRLVIDGKFNKVAIMQRAWSIVRCDKRVGIKTTFASALRQAWNDARVKMDLYLIEKKREEAPVEVKQANVLRDFFITMHPEYKYYDSSWR